MSLTDERNTDCVDSIVLLITSIHQKDMTVPEEISLAYLDRTTRTGSGTNPDLTLLSDEDLKSLAAHLTLSQHFVKYGVQVSFLADRRLFQLHRKAA